MQKYNLKEDVRSIYDVLSFNHNNLSLELADKILKSYAKLKLYHNLNFLGTDPKFIGQANKLVSLYDFINRNMQTQDVVLSDIEIIKTLFGNDDFLDLKKEFETVNSIIKTNRKKGLAKYKRLLKEKENENKN